MRRINCAALLMMVLATSCVFGGSPQGAADELVDLADGAGEVTYAAIYRYELKGPLAPAVRTRLEIVQDPPVSVRKLETATPDSEGKLVSLRSWQVRNEGGDYSCTDYVGVGVRCVANPIAGGTFGSAQIDDFFDTPGKQQAFSSVVKSSRRVRILSEQGACYEAIPETATEPPVTSPQPAATPERFRYELCYADDGILLRGRRTVLEDVESGRQREVVVEAVSISRVVEADELRLPGPVVDAEDLQR
jgi:hypothetical protein